MSQTRADEASKPRKVVGDAPSGGWEAEAKRLQDENKTLGERFSGLSERLAAVEAKPAVNLARSKIEELFLEVLTNPRTDTVAAGLRAGVTQWFSSKFLEAVAHGHLQEPIKQAANEVLVRLATPQLIDQILHNRPINATQVKDLSDLVKQTVEAHLKVVRLAYPR